MRAPPTMRDISAHLFPPTRACASSKARSSAGVHGRALGDAIRPPPIAMRARSASGAWPDAAASGGEPGRKGGKTTRKRIWRDNVRENPAGLRLERTTRV